MPKFVPNCAPTRMRAYGIAGLWTPIAWLDARVLPFLVENIAPCTSEMLTRFLVAISFCTFLATTATLLSRTEAGRHKSPDIVALFPLCRRTRKKHWVLLWATLSFNIQFRFFLSNVFRVRGGMLSKPRQAKPFRYQAPWFPRTTNSNMVNPCWSPFHESANQSHASDIKSSSLRPRKMTRVAGNGKNLVQHGAVGAF